MKRTFIALLLITVSVTWNSGSVQAQNSTRSRESFNQNWKFIKYFNASTDAVTRIRNPKDSSFLR